MDRKKPLSASTRLFGNPSPRCWRLTTQLPSPPHALPPLSARVRHLRAICPYNLPAAEPGPQGLVQVFPTPEAHGGVVSWPAPRVLVLSPPSKSAIEKKGHGDNMGSSAGLRAQAPLAPFPQFPTPAPSAALAPPAPGHRQEAATQDGDLWAREQIASDPQEPAGSEADGSSTELAGQNTFHLFVLGGGKTATHKQLQVSQRVRAPRSFPCKPLGTKLHTVKFLCVNRLLVINLPGRRRPAWRCQAPEACFKNEQHANMIFHSEQCLASNSK